jgi:ParB family transcriptional regulator, chromosome partitioning protein
VITTDKALLDISEYEGQITTDLFGEHGVFADPETFWKAQTAAVSQRVEAFIADGWKDVICLECGTFFHRWDHQSRTKRQGGKFYVELRHDGTVTFHEGYVSQAEARRREKAKFGQDDAPAAPVKPEMSGPLYEYILLNRHDAAQASLAAQPAIALRLIAAHAMIGSALWQVRAHECAIRKEDTRASLECSKAPGAGL